MSWILGILPPHEHGASRAAPARVRYSTVMNAESKKVFYLITKSNWGGAQHYVYTLAQATQNQGMQVAVLAGGTGALTEKLAESGIRYIPIHALMRDVSLLGELRSFTQLLRILKTERPDVLHVNSSKAGGIGALAGRLAGVRRIVFTAHGWPHQESRPLLARTFIWLASLATVLLSHRVVVLSKREYAIAPTLSSKDKLRIIPVGIAPFPLLPYAEARTELNLSDGFWFCTGTELTRNKGIDITLRAFAQIKDRYEDARLLVLGTGELRNSLEALAQELGILHRVQFAGFIPNARQYFSAIDCFVLGSRKEGLPFVLLEAGMAHVPVIATRVGSVENIIQDEETGLVVPPNSPTQLAAALTRMLDDADVRNRVREHLHAHVARNFSEDEMIAATCRLYIEP